MLILLFVKINGCFVHRDIHEYFDRDTGVYVYLSLYPRIGNKLNVIVIVIRSSLSPPTSSSSSLFLRLLLFLLVFLQFEIKTLIFHLRMGEGTLELNVSVALQFGNFLAVLPSSKLQRRRRRQRLIFGAYYLEASLVG